MSHVFLAFSSSYDDSVFGEDVPIGVVVRVEDSVYQRLQSFGSQVVAGDLGSVELRLDPDAFRWIKQIGFTSDNAVAPIEGFMSAEDVVYATEEFLNAKIGVTADFMDQCQVYEPPMNDAGMKLALLGGKLMVAPTGWGQLDQMQFNYGGLYEPWSKIMEKAFQEVFEPPADSARSFFETVLQIKVLSEDTPAEGMSLAALAEAMESGDCVGSIVSVQSREITSQQTAQSLYAMGSQPGFFRLGDDGVCLDEQASFASERKGF
jgi:hypothetical protein